MSPVSFRFTALVLLGWLCIGVQCQPSCDILDRLSVKVDIVPKKGFDCDAKDAKRIGGFIKKVTGKSFNVYANQTDALESANLDEFCTVGSPTSNRALLRLMTTGWGYLTSYDCRFCTLDKYDDRRLYGPPEGVGPPALAAPATEFGVAMATAATANARDVKDLKKRLERKLTRILTQKVNKHPKSCLRGSKSKVTVTIEQIQGSGIMVCP